MGEFKYYCCHGNLCNGKDVLPQECSDLSIKTSGVYVIYPYGLVKPVKVYCYVDSEGIWTTIQKRLDGSVDFYRNWTEYKNGFGDANTEYWLGNDIIHDLSSNGYHILKIVLTDWANVTKYAEYNTFLVDDEQHKYLIHESGYSGNTGDAFYNGYKFSTYDQDNDVSTVNCAQYYHGAWWYSQCHCCNLNDKYFNGQNSSYSDGIEWWRLHGQHYSLKTTYMLIRKK